MNKNLRLKAILTVFLLISILTTILLIINIREQKNNLDSMLAEKAAGAEFLVSNLENMAFSHFKTRITNFININKEIVEIFARRNRTELFQKTSRAYNVWKAENPNFYIMHFYLPNNTSFLRVHQPKMYGDDLSEVRPIVREVNQKRKQRSGYETSRYGLYYRIVQPVFYHGDYIGCLELGIKVDELLQTVKQRISPNIVIAIKTESWKKATKLQSIEQYVIDDYMILSDGNSLFSKQNILFAERKGNANAQFEHAGKTYTLLSNIKLRNFVYHAIAKIYIAMDVTEALGNMNRTIIEVVSLAFILAILTSLIIYYTIGNLFQKILVLNQSLQSANQQLTTAQCHKENIVCAISDGLLVTTPGRIITKVNPSVCELLGMKEENLLGKDILFLFKNQKETRAILLSSIEKQETVRSECVLVNADKKEIPVLFASKPIYDDNRIIRGIVCITTDIQDRKEAEKAVSQLNKELELRVRMRTSELAESNLQLRKEVHERKLVEKHLREAQKMKAIGTLAGGIAHDFNNILSGIVGNAQLAKELYPKGTDIIPYVDQVIKGAFRAVSLIKQILTFSRQTEQDRHPVLIHLIIKEATNLLRATIPSNIEMRLEVNSDDNAVMADPTQLHQIVMNLCTNAYQAMVEKGGILTVRLTKVRFESQEKHQELPPGDYVKLEVGDTGCGIDETTMERIFEPYFTTKQMGEGTGLGLSVVHGIVKYHYGDIKVRSFPGEGTTFTIYFPCFQSATVEISEDEITDNVRSHNEHILLVDDETEIVEMLGELLGGLGYNITCMNDSVEAYHWFVQNHKEVDLVVTDMTMPKMTGLELSEKMMQIRPDLPVILAAGYSELLNKTNFKEKKIRALIEKPYPIEKLAQQIQAVL